VDPAQRAVGAHDPIFDVEQRAGAGALPPRHHVVAILRMNHVQPQIGRDVEIGRRALIDRLSGGADEQQRVLWNRLGPDHVNERRDDGIKLLADHAERALRCHTRGALLGFMQGAVDHRTQPLQAVLQHIVGRASPHCLDGAVLADGAGYEDERDVGPRLPRK
jgi:hypothetical protein